MRKLNEEAVRAIISEDYAKAISLLDESLTVAKWNITYLNLGRAYQLAGKCSKSMAALEKAKTAPQVKEPRPEVVQKKAEKYIGELEASCSEEDLNPGSAAKKSSASADSSDEAGSDEASPEETEVAAPAEPTEPPRTGSGRRTVGYVLTGVGAVAAGSAVFFGLQATNIEDDITSRAEQQEPVPADQVTRAEFIDEGERAATFRTISLSSAIASGVLVGAGLYFVLSDSGESKTAIRLDAGPNAVGITFTTPF